MISTMKKMIPKSSIKLLKLSQILKDLNNSEEADLVRSFIDQPDPMEEDGEIYPPDQETKVFKDSPASQPFESYPIESEDPEVTSFKYYRDLAIQTYLDLFYPGTNLVSELGSGAFSDAFLATKGGRSIAIKFSKSPKEWSPYSEIKNKKDSLPPDLKTLLPTIYEAREITASQIDSLIKRISDSEGPSLKLSSYFKYKSFIATELLMPLDMGIEDLMYEPNFFNEMIKNEKDLLPKVLSILKSWITSWEWSQSEENSNLNFLKNILSNKETLKNLAIDICSNLISLENSEEDLWLDDDLHAPEEVLGGSFIRAAVDSFKMETKKLILSLVKMNLPPNDTSTINQIEESLSLLISGPSIGLKKDLIKMIRSFSESFPQYSSYRVKNVKMQSFLDKLNRLKEYGIRWGDIHSGNLMMRSNSTSHGYGDLVVADVGRFKFKD